MPAFVQPNAEKSSRGYAPSFFAGDHLARISPAHERCEQTVDAIRGKLEVADHLKLYEAAFYADGPILEIGRLHGRSTTLLALGSEEAGHEHHITSIDIHPAYTETTRRHLRDHGVPDARVTLLDGDSSTIVAGLPRASFDVIFIDGDHSYEGVRKDCDAIAGVARPGAALLFHDYFHAENDTGEYGVRRAVEKFADDHHVQFRGRYGGIAIFEFVSARQENLIRMPPVGIPDGRGSVLTLVEILPDAVAAEPAPVRDDVRLVLVSGPERVTLDPPRSSDVPGHRDTYIASPVFVAELEDAVVIPAAGTMLSSRDELVHESLPSAHYVEQTMSTGDVIGWAACRNDVRRVSGSALVLENFRMPNYYHWWFDSISRVWLTDTFTPWEGCRLLVWDGMAPFQRDVLEALGLADRILEVDSDPVVVEHAIFSAGLAHPSAMRMSPLMPAFAEWARERLGVRTSDRRRRLLVSRDRTRTRQFANEQEVARELEPLGFEGIAFEDLDPRFQAQAAADAELILAPHGAGLANLMFAAPGAGVVEIFSAAGAHDSVYRRVASMCGQPYAAVTGRGSGELDRPNAADIEVAPERVIAVIDAVHDGSPAAAPRPADTPSRSGTRLLHRLHADDPYEGFPLDEWPEDLQGWGSDHPVFTQAIHVLKPDLIIEVGSWKGRSAVHMAGVCKAAGVTPAIVCIDTWLGSPEHFLGRDKPELYASLRMRYGYPQLYRQFLANVLHQGHDDVVVPLPQTSDNGSQILRRLKISADIVYIDAAHEYLPVLQDLRNYWPLVREGGVLIGDDFKFPDVARAAGDFVREEGLELFGDTKKFVLAKGPMPAGITLPAVSIAAV